MSKLGELLKEKRTLANKTQEEVSKEFGYTTTQFISNWERGVSAPPPGKLTTLARLYSVDPEEILTLIESEAAQRLKTKLRTKYEKEATTTT